MIRTTLALCLFATAAHAGPACPPSYEGHPLARMDGASLYAGAVRDNALLAPTRQARDWSGSNVWTLGGGVPVTMVCRYENSPRALAMQLPAGVRECVQDLAHNSFACR